MGNVTEQAKLQPLRTRLDLLLTSYRSTLQADDARLQAAMREYEAVARAAHHLRLAA